VPSGLSDLPPQAETAVSAARAAYALMNRRELIIMGAFNYSEGLTKCS